MTDTTTAQPVLRFSLKVSELERISYLTEVADKPGTSRYPILETVCLSVSDGQLRAQATNRVIVAEYRPKVEELSFDESNNSPRIPVPVNFLKDAAKMAAASIRPSERKMRSVLVECFEDTIRVCRGASQTSTQIPAERFPAVDRFMMNPAELETALITGLSAKQLGKVIKLAGKFKQEKLYFFSNGEKGKPILVHIPQEPGLTVVIQPLVAL